MKKLVLKHLLIWLVLSLAYFFSVEALIKVWFAGTHGVELWLAFVFGGLILIFVVMATALIINILRHRRRLKTGRK